jgi:amidase
VGPLAKTIKSLEFFTKTIFNSHPENYDDLCIPLPWKEPVLSGRKLVFGVIKCDKYVTPTPAVARALERTITAVKKQGHEVIEWEAFNHDKLDAVADAVFTSDGAKFVTAAREGEPLFPYMEPYGRAVERTGSEIWGFQVDILKTQREYFKRWNDSRKLSKSGQIMDGIIMPTAPVSSHPAHHFSYVGYTSIWNAIDYPSVTYPVLESDKSIDDKPDHTPLSEKDRKVWLDYNPATYDKGMVGLQIVCRRYEDEKAVKLAAVIAEALENL